MKRLVFWTLILAASLPVSARAAEFDETLAVSPGGTLSVHLDSGSVQVESQDADEVRIEAHTHGWARRDFDFDLQRDGNDVRFEGSHAGWFPFGVAGRVEVRVRVPREFSVELRTGGGAIELEQLRGRVEARTSGGAIELDRAEGGPVRLQTSGGAIRASEVRGELSAETSGGRIEVSEAEGSVEARTSGGRIELRDVTGPVEAHTSGGGIYVRFAGAPEGTLETSGGPVEVVLPEDAGVDLDARTSGGPVRLDDELPWRGSRDTSQAVGEIGGGGPSLRLRTSGGPIEVRVR